VEAKKIKYVPGERMFFISPWGQSFSLAQHVDGILLLSILPIVTQLPENLIKTKAQINMVALFLDQDTVVTTKY
jgi:hypothetical protein